MKNELLIYSLRMKNKILVKFKDQNTVLPYIKLSTRINKVMSPMHCLKER